MKVMLVCYNVRSNAPALWEQPRAWHPKSG